MPQSPSVLILLRESYREVEGEEEEEKEPRRVLKAGLGRVTRAVVSPQKNNLILRRFSWIWSQKDFFFYEEKDPVEDVSKIFLNGFLSKAELR